MALDFKNAFEINKIITQNVLHEHDVEADKFAMEIARISIQLKRISGDKFEYNENCCICDVTTDENLDEVFQKLDIVLRDYPYIAYKDHGETYLAICPYDQLGISIEEVIDEVFDIID
ncbi:hypothetical protein [Butyrivibrio sp. AC2005]|uniref:hypothetical protein n=1 Tax=Butyrivibrio sp. AC2005 TaxID=1280672 RepID=UPI00041A35EF|nr:hypothetical protein [Butyrivibrio sp. AC2005]